MARFHRNEGRAILSRIAAPGLALFVVIVVAGLLLTPPGLAIATSETSINLALERSRTETWNTITLAWSLLGSQGGIIGVGLFVAAVIGVSVWLAIDSASDAVDSSPVYTPVPGADPTRAGTLWECLDAAGSDPNARTTCIREHNRTVTEPHRPGARGYP